ncbi:MAG: hypothetical protein M9936_11965 [Caldilinea sp.]|nr:hypothetical protein [Caldilineaceae bacterium]MCB9117356.1 hypothetical protein [Caldilineaceae bacterium]MCO5210406.1 hypothetical protein [Caldilinea sp.]
MPCRQERTLKHSRRSRAIKPIDLAASETQENPRASAQSAPSAFYLAALLALAALLLSAAPLAAQDGAQAGLVIVHGDGSVTTQCVAFAEESITGAELLVRSGLDVAMEASSMGATICRLDGEGCGYPQESCFCQCEGSSCIYWSYWRLGDEGWTYSNLGAGNSTVRDGDVDGWRWGEGTVERAEEPPALTFEEVCTTEKEELTTESAEGTEVSAGASVTLIITPVTDPHPTELRPATDPGSDTAAVSGQAVSAPQASSGIKPVAVLGVVLGLAVVVPLAALAAALLRRREKGNRA